ncbi:unnamed protein product, partial [Prorocentrum cordatum]
SLSGAGCPSRWRDAGGGSRRAAARRPGRAVGGRGAASHALRRAQAMRRGMMLRTGPDVASAPGADACPARAAAAGRHPISALLLVGRGTSGELPESQAPRCLHDGAPLSLQPAGDPQGPPRAGVGPAAPEALAALGAAPEAPQPVAVGSMAEFRPDMPAAPGSARVVAPPEQLRAGRSPRKAPALASAARPGASPGPSLLVAPAALRGTEGHPAGEAAGAPTARGAPGGRPGTTPTTRRAPSKTTAPHDQLLDSAGTAKLPGPTVALPSQAKPDPAQAAASLSPARASLPGPDQQGAVAVIRQGQPAWASRSPERKRGSAPLAGKRLVEKRLATEAPRDAADAAADPAQAAPRGVYTRVFPTSWNHTSRPRPSLAREGSLETAAPVMETTDPWSTVRMSDYSIEQLPASLQHPSSSSRASPESTCSTMEPRFLVSPQDWPEAVVARAGGAVISPARGSASSAEGELVCIGAPTGPPGGARRPGTSPAAPRARPRSPARAGGGVTSPARCSASSAEGELVCIGAPTGPPAGAPRPGTSPAAPRARPRSPARAAPPAAPAAPEATAGMPRHTRRFLGSKDPPRGAAAAEAQGCRDGAAEAHAQHAGLRPPRRQRAGPRRAAGAAEGAAGGAAADPHARGGSPRAGRSRQASPRVTSPQGQRGLRLVLPGAREGGRSPSPMAVFAAAGAVSPRPWFPPGEGPCSPRSITAELASEGSALGGSIRLEASAEGEGLQPAPGPWSRATTQRSIAEGAPTAGVQRSVRLLQALHAMRRLAGDEDEGGEGDAEGCLLNNTLLNTEDSSEQLWQQEEQMVKHVGFTAEAGGARHASQAVTCRVLEIVRRKRQLLQTVEARTQLFEAEVARKGDLLREVVAGTLESPPELMRLEDFLESVTHPGELAEANRADFSLFASTFRLPADHGTLVRLREQRGEMALWWAESCMAEAAKGTDYAALKTMRDIAMMAGLDRDHFLSFRMKRVLIDRVADWAVEQAELARQHADAPGTTLAADARKVEDTIESAVKEGVPESDPRIRQARAAMKAIRDADFARRRREQAEQRRQRGALA